MTSDDRRPIRFKNAAACVCGAIFRVNVEAGPRAVAKAVAQFTDAHAGFGHGPADIVTDKRQP